MSPYIILILLALTAVFCAYSVHAAETLTGTAACSNPNLRPADRAILKCDDRTTAIQYLNSICASGHCQTATPGFENLNPTFAICAAGFFQAYETRYGKGSVTVNSAYRSADAERALCRNNPACGAQMNNPTPTSNHSKGFAIDVQPTDGNYQRMWDFARANPQLGVCFPFENGGAPGSSFRDRPHMILQGIPGSGEAASCRARGYGSQPCNGLNIDMSAINTPAPSTPTSAFANAIRQALGVSPAQPAMSPPPLPSPISSSQSPLQAFNPLPQPVPSGVSPQIQNTGADTSAATSVADRLEELAFGSPPASSTAATSVPLVVNGTDASTLSGSNPTEAEVAPAGGISSPVGSTFISGDISWGNAAPGAPVSGLQATLMRLKTILTTFLQYLVPFGGRVPPEMEMNGEVEAVE